ncbi:MAG: cupin domain-containing protein [Paracoccaceae bacterium]
MTDVEHILTTLGQSYRAKVRQDLALTVNLEISDESGRSRTWHVIVAPGGDVALHRGRAADAQFDLQTSAETLRRIDAGELTALTAAGREHLSQPAPLDIRPGDGVEMTRERLTAMYAFLQHFFNPSVPERVPLGEAHARLVHGAHAIPLYYCPGFRSAWYRVNPGERLNEPGDTNPFPQAFIFIKGTGVAKIGDETVPVKADEAYYIPPGADHVVWTEGDDALELIFLAWGEEA